MRRARNVAAKFTFVDEHQFRYLCNGLTFDATDLVVLDKALEGLNAQSGLPDMIVSHSRQCGFWPAPDITGAQTIVNLNKSLNSKGQVLSMVAVNKHHDIPDKQPALHINLHSPTLEIPQRVEIPLRYVLKGLPSLDKHYMVYLHVLKMSDGKDLVYYGITKRGWMKRFNEHVKAALQHKSGLLFASTLRKAIQGRVDEIRELRVSGDIESTAVLVGNYHVVCGAGMTKDAALAAEEYLVKKYSLGHPEGLNMIPGGRG